MKEEPQPGGDQLLSVTPPENNFSKRFKNRFLRFLGLKKTPTISEEVVEFIEEHDPQGVEVSSTERSMVSNVLKLSQTSVGNIMIPRADIVAVSKDISLSGLKKLIIEKEHTRIPVYEASLDNVLGFIHSKDLLPLIGSRKGFNIEDVIRKVIFVPPSMKALDLLVKMRDKRTHMAIVLDEHSGTDGLVTLEDVMEEIVGDIEDEHDDVDVPGIHRIDEKTYHVNARTEIEVVESELGLSLRQDMNEEFETLGGLVFLMAGHVPQKGEVMEHSSGVHLEIVDADQRRVNTVLIRLPQTEGV